MSDAGSEPDAATRPSLRRTSKTRPPAQTALLTFTDKEKIMNKLLVVIFSLLMSSTAIAAEPYKGEVKKVDASAGKVTLTHGAIKKFEMEDGMTMVYRVKDASMLTNLKAGDRINFDTDKINGKFTITKMKKAK